MGFIFQTIPNEVHDLFQLVLQNFEPIGKKSRTTDIMHSYELLDLEKFQPTFLYIYIYIYEEK